LTNDREVVWPPQPTQYNPKEPTWIEQRCYSALRRLGVDFEPQFSVAYWVLDAFLPRYDIGLECDGCGWHSCPEHSYDPPQQVALNIARSERRDRQLKLRFGIQVVRIWGHDLGSDAQALASVRAALQEHGVALGDDPNPKED
jgi:G:T-mismatch repair DNA endonuclease (very short patch repair protein)